jgi:hypothetical protein
MTTCGLWGYATCRCQFARGHGPPVHEGMQHADAIGISRERRNFGKQGSAGHFSVLATTIAL